MNKIDISTITKILNSDRNIDLAYLFGSAAKGRKKPPKDIDIAVYLKKDIRGLDKLDYLTRLSSAIEKELKLPADVVILNSASPALGHQVLKYGQLILERKKGLASKFTVSTLTRYFDYLNILNFFLSYRSKIGRRS